ncbi:hypothetical protein BLOT_002830 [Blomia tropicalis]|nr:hypothetical protein BLOT_002830 [Blomia tropicalis]
MNGDNRGQPIKRKEKSTGCNRSKEEWICSNVNTFCRDDGRTQTKIDDQNFGGGSGDGGFRYN